MTRRNPPEEAERFTCGGAQMDLLLSPSPTKPTYVLFPPTLLPSPAIVMQTALDNDRRSASNRCPLPKKANLCAVRSARKLYVRGVRKPATREDKQFLSLWVHVEVTFGILLSSLWDHFPISLGSLCNHFAVTWCYITTAIK